MIIITDNAICIDIYSWCGCWRYRVTPAFIAAKSCYNSRCRCFVWKIFILYSYAFRICKQRLNPACIYKIVNCCRHNISIIISFPYSKLSWCILRQLIIAVAESRCSSCVVLTCISFFTRHCYSAGVAVNKSCCSSRRLMRFTVIGEGDIWPVNTYLFRLNSQSTVRKGYIIITACQTTRRDSVSIADISVLLIAVSIAERSTQNILSFAVDKATVLHTVICRSITVGDRLRICSDRKRCRGDVSVHTCRLCRERIIACVPASKRIAGECYSYVCSDILICKYSTASSNADVIIADFTVNDCCTCNGRTRCAVICLTVCFKTCDRHTLWRDLKCKVIDYFFIVIRTFRNRRNDLIAASILRCAVKQLISLTGYDLIVSVCHRRTLRQIFSEIHSRRNRFTIISLVRKRNRAGIRCLVYAPYSRLCTSVVALTSNCKGIGSCSCFCFYIGGIIRIHLQWRCAVTDSQYRCLRFSGVTSWSRIKCQSDVIAAKILRWDRECPAIIMQNRSLHWIVSTFWYSNANIVCSDIFRVFYLVCACCVTVILHGHFTHADNARSRNNRSSFVGAVVTETWRCHEAKIVGIWSCLFNGKVYTCGLSFHRNLRGIITCISRCGCTISIGRFASADIHDISCRNVQTSCSIESLQACEGSNLCSCGVC